MDASGGNPVLDLFCGMGSVAEALAPDVPVMVNDFLRFTTVFARAKFLNSDRTQRETAMRHLLPPYLEHRAHLRKKFGRRLAAEKRHAEGGPDGLARWMSEAPHVGRSEWYRRAADTAARSRGPDRYEMITRYYSAGYFSTSQAIDLDSGTIRGIDPIEVGRVAFFWYLCGSTTTRKAHRVVAACSSHHHARSCLFDRSLRGGCGKRQRHRR